MEKFVAALAALLLAAGVPAFAQDAPSVSEQFLVVVRDCLAKNQNASNPPEEDIAICEAMLVSLEEIAAANAGNISPRDQNTYHLYRSLGHSAKAAAYGDIDGARTARVCTAIEAAWTDVSRLVDANASASTIETHKALRATSVGPVAKCREEKGTPPGAAPLPQ